MPGRTRHIVRRREGTGRARQKACGCTGTYGCEKSSALHFIPLKRLCAKSITTDRTPQSQIGALVNRPGNRPVRMLSCATRPAATTVPTMTATPTIGLPAADDTAIDWRNLYWVGAVLAVMVGTILAGNDWLLNFLHVLTGLLWTGIDLFMGFVIGPIMRRTAFPVRQAITTRLMPRMMFIMPTLSTVAPTTGWFLASRYGFTDLAFPEMWWLVAALAITTILSVQGVLVLLPTNILVYLEMRKSEPDGERIGRLMRRYVRVVAFQGLMQVAIILIMARFATGL